MPSLEQIIRPFVVDPTTPPVPVVTTLNRPPPDLVRLNIGIGSTRLSDLSSRVAPIVPSTTPASTTKSTIQYKALSSSHSWSVTNYMTGVVREKSTVADAATSGEHITGGSGGGSQSGAGTTDNNAYSLYATVTYTTQPGKPPPPLAVFG